MTAQTDCKIESLEDIAIAIGARNIPVKYSSEDNGVTYSGHLVRIMAAESVAGKVVFYTVEFKYKLRCLEHLRNSRLLLSSIMRDELRQKKISPQSRKLVEAGGTASAHNSIYVPSFEELADFIAEHYEVGL